METNTLQLLNALRAHSREMYLHSLAVAILSKRLGARMKLSAGKQKQLLLIGVLHDVGKLDIKKQLLEKPAALSATEFAEMQRHPLYGYQRLKGNEICETVAAAVLQHHERCDGSGYPYGLTKEEIGLEAKIVMLADVYNAMTSARVYKPPLTDAEAMALLKREQHKYDQEFVQVLEQYVKEKRRKNNVLRI